MYLRLISVDRIVFEGEVASVRAPVSDGQIAVLPHHEPFASTIVPGALVFQDDTESMHAYAVGSGVLRVEDDTVSVLVDMAEHAVNINTEATLSRKNALEDEIQKLRAG